MKNKAAQKLGRLGGLATARNRTPEERSKAAEKASKVRWKNHVTKKNV